jgi:hypothetical protein
MGKKIVQQKKPLDQTNLYILARSYMLLKKVLALLNLMKS